MSRTATTRPEPTVYPVYGTPPRAPDASSIVELVAALGGGLLIATSRRGSRGTLMRVAGAAMLGFAARPAIVRTIREHGARRRSLTARASLVIARPIPEVFTFFKDFESFPQIAGSLRSVTDFQDGRSHWEIYTPSGGIASWDVVVTKYLPNSVIGWESVRGSAIEMSGIVRFTPRGSSASLVELDVVYRPAHTGFADALNVLGRRAPERPLFDLLERARFYLESLPSPAPRSDVETAE